MKRRTFADEERSILLSHTDIVKVTARSVSFSESFKRFSLTEHAKGRRPQDIFTPSKTFMNKGLQFNFLNLSRFCFKP